jgi:dipeptidyl aminopeptidase/acylaminoacyl peptidase
MTPAQGRRRRRAGLRTRLGFAAACLAAACSPAGDGAPSTDPSTLNLIARDALFGDPQRSAVSVSPDGRWIAFLAPHLGRPNVFVAPLADPGRARPVTVDAQRGIRFYRWAPDSSAILFLQDDRGDENWRLFQAPLAGGDAQALTPAGARAEIISLSQQDPQGVLVSLNTRDRAWFDVYRIDLQSGERTLVERNDRRFAEFYADRSNTLRLAVETLDDGRRQVWVRDGEARPGAGRWRALMEIAQEDSRSTRIVGFEADGRRFLMLDPTDEERAALVRVDAETGAKEPLAQSASADLVDVLINPQTYAAEAVASEYLRWDWRALTDGAQLDLATLDGAIEGDFRITSRSQDNRYWIVEETAPRVPGRTLLYDRQADPDQRVRRLFDHRPALQDAPLQPMQPREIVSRDGLTLVSYLTLPPEADADGDGRPERPSPMVLLVHGGPWARDSYGFDPRHQWLANRGYAVLSVNFRGSTGFGRSFVDRGDLEWGGRMQDDLSDAVAWAVGQRIADPERVAIMGGSYGGYAALAGLAFTPEQYACGVSLVGPSNLTSLLGSIPPYWEADRADLYARVGDPRTAEGRRLLRERSPLFAVSRIEAPLLIAQGGRDPRVPQAESDQMAAALRRRGAPVTYLLYPDEGHGLARQENRIAFYATVENFLSGCLGGRAQPIGRAFEGALVYGVTGAELVPGLAEVAPAPPRRAPARRPAPAAPTEEATQADPEGGPKLPAPDEPIRTR